MLITLTEDGAFRVRIREPSNRLTGVVIGRLTLGQSTTAMAPCPEPLTSSRDQAKTRNFGIRATRRSCRRSERSRPRPDPELQTLEASSGHLFKAPPVEWVAARLGKILEVFEGETVRSALLLRQILGPIRLLSVTPDGKPCYQAQTAVRVLDLLEASDGGSNLLRWWRRWASNPRPEILGDRHLHQ